MTTNKSDDKLLQEILVDLEKLETDSKSRSKQLNKKLLFVINKRMPITCIIINIMIISMIISIFYAYIFGLFRQTLTNNFKS
jgi:hypothetical protein